MTQRFVVTGTDTNIGKTVFSAALADALGACYWKPVQAGLEGETDSETVMRLGGIPAGRIIPEAWRLRTPASPHRAARLDNVEIQPELLVPPSIEASLIVEGAGGVMVPGPRTDRAPVRDRTHWRARKCAGVLKPSAMAPGWREMFRARQRPVPAA